MFIAALNPVFTTASESYGRGKCASVCGMTVGQASLPTDPIGSMTLTLTNVVVGSAYRIETQADGTLVTQGTAGSSTVVLTLDCYSVGSANNDLRIKVRKGTAAPFYKPFETLATAVVGSLSIYIAQIAD
jgi:hypothetical protein